VLLAGIAIGVTKLPWYQPTPKFSIWIFVTNYRRQLRVFLSVFVHVFFLTSGGWGAQVLFTAQPRSEWSILPFQKKGISSSGRSPACRMPISAAVPTAARSDTKEPLQLHFGILQYLQAPIGDTPKIEMSKYPNK